MRSRSQHYHDAYNVNYFFSFISSAPLTLWYCAQWSNNLYFVENHKSIYFNSSQVVVEIASKSNFICQHERSCHPNCLERQKRNCYRLMKAVRAVYGEEMFPRVKDEELEEKVRRFEAKTKRKVQVDIGWQGLWFDIDPFPLPHPHSLLNYLEYTVFTTCIVCLREKETYLVWYCKSGNICGTLIFAKFAQSSASANSKTRENICDILYAHFGHVGVVYWPCVLMQMGNILESVWDLLCFCAAHTCKCIIHWMMLTLFSTKMTSEHLLSANLTTCEYVFVLPNAKN